MKTLNFRLIGVFILLALLSAFLVTNQELTKNTVKTVLQWQHLNITLWLSFMCCFSIHYLSIREDQNYYGGLIYKDFGKFADSAFAVVTYGLASTTSAAILKGIYIQQFFQEKVYFNHFDQIDIYSMLIVCLFLLGYSIYSALNAFINAISLSKAEKAIGV